MLSQARSIPHPAAPHAVGAPRRPRSTLRIARALFSGSCPWAGRADSAFPKLLAIAIAHRAAA